MSMFTKRTILLSFIIIGILAGCDPSKPTATPSSTPPQATVTDLPSLKYQLTYVTSFVSDGRQYQGIFAVDIQCQDQKMLCFDSPKLLLKIPKQSGENPRDPHGEILTYDWSPDGKKIAFSAIGVDEDVDIFVSDWNGEIMENITMSSSFEIYPSWSKDNRLVYITCSGRCRAVVSDEGGANSTAFAFDTAVDFASWMPDGEHLLFVGTDNKSVYQIYTANIDGSNVKQVTQTLENNIVPYASTNGELIFFTRSQTYVDNNFNYNIFSIDIEGKMESAVTLDKDLISFNPSVAPFGNWLAFEQGQDRYNIYVASFDGEQIIRVTKGEENKGIPKWRVTAGP